jgi:hypothetical protein
VNKSLKEFPKVLLNLLLKINNNPHFLTQTFLKVYFSLKNWNLNLKLKFNANRLFLINNYSNVKTKPIDNKLVIKKFFKI